MRVVTDEKVMASALLNFETLVKIPSLDQQAVTVNRIDPDEAPILRNQHP